MAAETSGPIRNWAGNITFTPATLHRPDTVAELRTLLSRHRRVKVLGTGHSFNRIADTDGALVSVRGLPRVLELDSAAGLVRVSAGTRYGELTGLLDEHGFALPNLGSLPHISVAGACATGTHGSGDRNPVLAAAVRGQALLTGDGEQVELDQPDLAGAVLHLGALGVVTELTLALVPAFELRQQVYEGLPFQTLADRFDEVSGAGYSVSVFTRWQHDSAGAVWVKSTGPLPDGPLLGARPAALAHHPVPGGDPATATEQLGVPGRWQHRLPHFRLEFTPSHGAEIQSEYFVDRDRLGPAVAAVRSLADQLDPVLLIGEVRTVAADQLWLSPCYQRDRVALHFTWVRDERAVAPVVAELEARLAELDAVPHWGKYFHTPPAELARLHPRLADFAALVGRYDPAGKFGNDYLRTILG